MIATLNIKQIVHNWLERKYQRRAFRQAVSRAYATFAQKYPEWSASHFDEHFLTHDAAHLLLRVGQGIASCTAFALAHVWSQQMMWYNEEKRQRLVAELAPIAADFLRLLEAELPVQEPVGQPILQPA
jgi:hypothetical protein